MNALALLAEASSGGQVQQIANTFGVDWPHLASQIISFAIVCFLLQRFAYKPILQMLEERRKQIAQGIAERAQIKEELAQAEVQKKEIMLQADAQATRLIEEAHSAAKKVRETEIQKATTAAGQLIARSREAAERERTEMLCQLKRELGALVVRATSIAAGRVLTVEDQRRMAEETLKQVGTAA